MMEQTNHSTDTLLASFQAGNMAAFSQLYNLHINVLFNYGLKLTIDKELLKDCIHDIFVKLYTKKDELGTIDNLRSYGSSSNLVVISFLFQLSSSFLILLKVVDMFAF